MYCQNCGNKLSASDRFCSKCGYKTEVESQPIQPDQPNAVKAFDKALMVLNANRKDGLLKRTNVYMVFFNDQLLFAELSPERQKTETKLLQQKIKQEGKGFFKGSAAMMSFWSHYGEKYYNMSPEEILKEDVNNIRIFNNDVNKFIFKPIDTNHDHSNNTQTTTGGVLEVHAKTGKIVANHSFNDGNRNIKKVLESLYGSRLKYKGILLIQLGGKKEGFR
ncbi:MAG: zinc ribbon domain-containing protein [Tissierellales bacterium]|nr:zinc ribbon domain-containing protein [Tissierellales bacterium]MBN2826485.1 zinc ribbon domain-containing protein [Tissierellales bacterium]